MGDHYKTAWSSKAKCSGKSWGTELYVGQLGVASMKILHMEKDKSTTLKYYRQKNEVLYVRAGTVMVEYDSEKYHWADPSDRKFKRQTLVTGDVFFVQSTCPYRLTALEDTEIIEIGDHCRDTSVKIDVDKEI